jgi:hypothetical protein
MCAAAQRGWDKGRQWSHCGDVPAASYEPGNSNMRRFMRSNSGNALETGPLMLAEAAALDERNEMVTISWKRLGRRFGAGLLGLLCVAGVVGPVGAQDAAALRARHAALRDQLSNNQFHRPLYVESSETAGDLKVRSTPRLRNLMSSRPSRSTRGRTFIHLSYSYACGMTAQVAMQAYLGSK